MKKFAFICFFNLLFFQPYLSFSQKSTIDSLQNILNSSREDTAKASILNQLARQLNGASDAKALNYSNELMELSKKINFQNGIANAYFNIGFYYDNISDYAKAQDSYEKAFDLMTKLKMRKEAAKTLGSIGNVFLSTGKYQQGLDYFLRSLRIAEEIADKKQIAASYDGLGNVYLYLNNDEKGLEYYFQALKIQEEIDDKRGASASIANIAIIYTNKKEYDKAIEYHFKSLKIDEALGYLLGVAQTYTNIGVAYYYKKDFYKCQEYFLKSLELYQKSGEQRGVANTTNNIGSVYVEMKNFPKALEYHQKSLEVARAIGAKDIIKNCYRDFSDAYFEMKDYKNAYDYHKLYSDEKDSLLNKESSKQIAEMQTKYDTEKKEHQITLLSKDKELQDAQVNRQKMVIWSVVGGLFFVLLFAGFISRSLRITRKQKQIIELQKIEVEHQKELVEVHQQEIIDSITYAKRLQEAILPPAAYVKQHLPHSFITYLPKDIVAGDFYWMEVIDNIIFIAVCDCTGHGVPGAMVSVVCSNALNRTVKEFGLRDTGKILDKVTELVVETFEKSDKDVMDGMDISLLAINKTADLVQWSGANNPLWYIQNGELIDITADKQPIGKHDNRKPFITHAIAQQPNTAFYLFTDGYADQFGGAKGKKFKYKQLEDKILASNNLSLTEQKEFLEKTFVHWKGNLEQVDDVCIIGIRL